MWAFLIVLTICITSIEFIKIIVKNNDKNDKNDFML